MTVEPTRTGQCVTLLFSFIFFVYYIKRRCFETFMNEITVVDARMGRGKSSAAIRYMNQRKGKQRFLYITPYLDEVGRICEKCDFDQPDSDIRSKSSELKAQLHMGRNIAATHSLFYLMDEDALQLVREKRYCLIIDESIQVIQRMNISAKDLDIIINTLADIKEDGKVVWRDEEYQGRFYDYKEMADSSSLYLLDSALLNILNPDLLRAFDQVFMLTYLFDGQYQKGYLDYFGFPYHIVGVEQDEKGFYFSDKPDAPPPADYKKLIHIEDSQRLNSVGEDTYTLSKAWYDRRGYNDTGIKALRTGLRRFFQKYGGDSNTRMWTCFKDDVNKLVDAKTGRFRGNFLQSTARATNQYRDRTEVAYMVNRFTDPNLMKFFYGKDVVIDGDLFALSEMLQWIWRSAIRDNKPINLYIPSRRMRQLLTDWIEKESKGGSYE